MGDDVAVGKKRKFEKLMDSITKIAERLDQNEVQIYRLQSQLQHVAQQLSIVHSRPQLQKNFPQPILPNQELEPCNPLQPPSQLRKMNSNELEKLKKDLEQVFAQESLHSRAFIRLIIDSERDEDDEMLVEMSDLEPRKQWQLYEFARNPTQKGFRNCFTANEYRLLPVQKLPKTKRDRDAQDMARVLE